MIVCALNGTPHTDECPHTHTHTHARTRAHTHTHTQDPLSFRDVSTRTTANFFPAYPGRGTIVLFATMSDGTVTRVNASRVAFSVTPSTGVVSIEADGSVQAVGFGTARIEATWLPAVGAVGCTLSANLSTAVTVTVALPSVLRVRVIGATTTLAYTGSVPALLGTPTHMDIQVVVDFVDGTSMDMTSDPLTRYDEDASAPMLDVQLQQQQSSSSVVRVTAAGQSSFGSTNLTVRIPELGVEENIPIDVVGVAAATVVATPYLPYAGSTSRVVAVLREIEGTGVYTRASLDVDLTLSNGGKEDTRAMLQRAPHFRLCCVQNLLRGLSSARLRLSIIYSLMLASRALALDRTFRFFFVTCIPSSCASLFFSVLFSLAIVAFGFRPFSSSSFTHVSFCLCSRCTMCRHDPRRVGSKSQRNVHADVSRSWCTRDADNNVKRPECRRYPGPRRRPVWVGCWCSDPLCVGWPYSHHECHGTERRVWHRQRGPAEQLACRRPQRDSHRPCRRWKRAGETVVHSQRLDDAPRTHDVERSNRARTSAVQKHPRLCVVGGC
jgi:hypothetical protein